MPPSFKRADRLKEVLLKEITDVVSRIKIKDPNIAEFLTFTGIELSEDIQTSVVFFSVFGSDEAKERTAVSLNKHRGFIRQNLGKRLTLRRIPDITFKFDSTPEKAAIIENIFSQIHSENATGDKK